MSRKKADRFEHNITATNVIQDGKDFFNKCKGLWKSELFKNNNPIILEIGCGKGEYTVGLGNYFPNINFIGIDLKGDRIAVGSKKANEMGLANVGFLRADVLLLENFFEENEISEIWITFPDPRPLRADIRKRLTSPRFLAIYKKLLIENGILHLKTDSEPFFDYSFEEINNAAFSNIIYTKNLYNSDLYENTFGIKTRFEEMFTEKGFKINYLECNCVKS